MTTYLGIPKDENEWLKYHGSCILFCGKYREKEYGDLVMETEEETKTRLINGLASVGVKCLHITFKWTDENQGTRSCECICEYNKPYEIHFSEFFIKGLTSFEFDSENPNCQLEFSFISRIE